MNAGAAHCKEYICRSKDDLQNSCVATASNSLGERWSQMCMHAVGLPHFATSCASKHDWSCT